MEGAPCGNCRWDNVEVSSSNAVALWASWRFYFYERRAGLTFYMYSVLFKKADEESECPSLAPGYLSSPITPR